MTASGAGLEKVGLPVRRTSAPRSRRSTSIRSRNSVLRFLAMSSSQRAAGGDASGARAWLLGLAHTRVERAHVLHSTSLVTTAASIPRQGPRTAEKRPAGPPATTSRILAGSSQRGISSSGWAPSTRAVFRPARAARQRAGEQPRTSPRELALSPSMSTKELGMLGADDEERVRLERPPVGAPGRGRRPAEGGRELLGRRERWSEIESGASAATSVTADDPAGGRARHGAAPMGSPPRSRRCNRSLAGMAERRPVESARIAASRERDDKAKRPSDG